MTNDDGGREKIKETQKEMKRYSWPHVNGRTRAKHMQLNGSPTISEAWTKARGEMHQMEVAAGTKPMHMLYAH
jgi:hypothetical protein